MAEDPVAVLSPLSEADKPRQGGERWVREEENET